MRYLSRQFRKSGFDYELVQAGERAFWYLKKQAGQVVAYEVWRKKINPERIIAGVTIEEGEAFPHDEAFGRWAWSFPTFDLSRSCFEREDGSTNE